MGQLHQHAFCLPAMVGACHRRRSCCARSSGLGGIRRRTTAPGCRLGVTDAQLVHAPTLERFHLEKQMNQRAAEILAACGRCSSARAWTRERTFSALAELFVEPRRLRRHRCQHHHGRRRCLSAADAVRGPGVVCRGQHRRRHVRRLRGRRRPATRHFALLRRTGSARELDGPGTRGRSAPATAPATATRSSTTTSSTRSGSRYLLHLPQLSGGQGMRISLSTNGITWTVGPCAHSSSGDDRESGWVDDNPATPTTATRSWGFEERLRGRAAGPLPGDGARRRPELGRCP